MPDILKIGFIKYSAYWPLYLLNIKLIVNWSYQQLSPSALNSTYHHAIIYPTYWPLSLLWVGGGTLFFSSFYPMESLWLLGWAQCVTSKSKVCKVGFINGRAKSIDLWSFLMTLSISASLKIIFYYCLILFLTVHPHSTLSCLFWNVIHEIDRT